VVTPDFLWRFHDGLAVTKSLADPVAIAGHLTEQKALFSAQRFHDVSYHHCCDMTCMTFRVSETVRATGGAARATRHRKLYVPGRKARDQGRLSQAGHRLIRYHSRYAVHA